MRKPSKTSKQERGVLPDFESHQDEARWFDMNRDRLMDIVSRHGKVIPARQLTNRLLTMRIPVADIELAKEIAQQHGVGYQSVLKKAIRVGLKAAG